MNSIKATQNLIQAKRSLEIRRLLAAAAKAREDALKRIEKGYGQLDSDSDLQRSDSDRSSEIDSYTRRDESGHAGPQDGIGSTNNDDHCSESDRSTDQKDAEDEIAKVHEEIIRKDSNTKDVISRIGDKGTREAKIANEDRRKHSGQLEDQLEKLMNLLSNDCAAREQLERQIERLQRELPAITAASRQSEVGVGNPEFYSPQQISSLSKDEGLAELTECLSRMRENHDMISERDVLIAKLKEELKSQEVIVIQLREQIQDLRDVASTLPQKDMAISRLTEEMQIVRTTFQALIDEKEGRISLLMNEVEMLRDASKTKDRNVESVQAEFEASQHSEFTAARENFDPHQRKISALQEELSLQKTRMEQLVRDGDRTKQKLNLEIETLQRRIQVDNERLDAVNLVLENSATFISSLDNASRYLEKDLKTLTQNILKADLFSSRSHISENRSQSNLDQSLIASIFGEDFDKRANDVLCRGDPEELEIFLQDCVEKIKHLRSTPQSADASLQYSQVEKSIAEKSAIIEHLKSGISDINDTFGHQPSILSLLDELSSDLEKKLGSAVACQEKHLMHTDTQLDHDQDDNQARFVDQARDVLDRGDPEEMEIALRDSLDLLQEQERRMGMLRCELHRRSETKVQNPRAPDGELKRLQALVSELEEELRCNQAKMNNILSEKSTLSNQVSTRLSHLINLVSASPGVQDVLDDLSETLKNQWTLDMQAAEQKRRLLMDLEELVDQNEDDKGLIEQARGAADRGDPEEIEVFLRDCIDVLHSRSRVKMVPLVRVRTMLQEVRMVVPKTEFAASSKPSRQTSSDENTILSIIKDEVMRLQAQLHSEPTMESVFGELRLALVTAAGANGPAPASRACEETPEQGEVHSVFREEEENSSFIEQVEGATERGDPEEMELFLRECTARLQARQRGSSRAAAESASASALASEVQVLRAQIAAKEAAAAEQLRRASDQEVQLSSASKCLDEIAERTTDLERILCRVCVAAESAGNTAEQAALDESLLRAARLEEELTAAKEEIRKSERLASEAAEERELAWSKMEARDRTIAELQEEIARLGELSDQAPAQAEANALAAGDAAPPQSGRAWNAAADDEEVAAAREAAAALVREAEGALDRGDPEEMELALRACVERLRAAPAPAPESRAAGAAESAGVAEDCYDAQWKDRFRDACQEVASAERERETERQRDRETERQRDRETERREGPVRRRLPVRCERPRRLESRHL
jgi:hypothetical protein